MPKITDEFIEEEICAHHFVIECCNNIIQTTYSLDWRELDAQSPNELLGLYRCPICHLKLSEKDILKRLKTPRLIKVNIDIKRCEVELYRKGKEDECNKPARFIKYFLDESIPPKYLCGLHRMFFEKRDKEFGFNTKYIKL